MWVEVISIYGYYYCRWCVFGHPIIAEPSNVVAFTKAAIALHNYLRTGESSVYCPFGFVDWEDGSGNVINRSWREEDASTGLTNTFTICQWKQTSLLACKCSSDYFNFTATIHDLRLMFVHPLPLTSVHQLVK